MGRYFVETRMSFGGKPSPTNFDGLAKTKDLLVCLRSGTPRSNVTRALDDSPCVASTESKIVERFTKEMKVCVRRSAFLWPQIFFKYFFCLRWRFPPLP